MAAGLSNPSSILATNYVRLSWRKRCMIAEAADQEQRNRSSSAASTSTSSSANRTLNPQLMTRPNFNPAAMALANSLFNASTELSVCKKPSLCQRKNTATICRRAATLCSLFEEVRDNTQWVPPTAMASFQQLRGVFRSIKALLRHCRHSSNLLLIMEQDLLAIQFLHLTTAMVSALSSLPYDLLEISVEVRDHVGLVLRQCQRSIDRAPESFADDRERQLQSDIVSVLEDFESQTSPASSKLKLIFDSLRLHDAIACEHELHLLETEKQRIKNEDSYRVDDIANINSLISFVRYARCVLYGLSLDSEVAIAGAGKCRKYDLSCSSMKKVIVLEPNQSSSSTELSVPEDFKCPISLELMVDPVTVASGQTYERASIAKWFAAGHATCPKTGAKLLHTMVIPNSNLRRLIMKWCAENDYILESTGNVSNSSSSGNSSVEIPSSRAAMEATKLTAEFLVEKLAKGTTEMKRQAVYELRIMTKEGNGSRESVAAAGALPWLVKAIIEETEAKTEENAITALLNLSIYDKNKPIMVSTQGAIEVIVRTLAKGKTQVSKENAAASLFSLTTSKECREQIGLHDDAINGLIKLLSSDSSSSRGKKDAAAALYNLALSQQLASNVAQCRVVHVATSALLDPEYGEIVAPEVVALLALLARTSPNDVLPFLGPSHVPKLVNLLSSQDTSDRCKEHTVTLLLSAAQSTQVPISRLHHSMRTLRSELRNFPGLFVALRHLIASGTPRSQRKATFLMKLLQRYEYF